jgi:hypothetical protein
MIHSGIENGADVYCIDHGIQAGDCPNPPPELIHFVSGELEASMYRESPQVKEGWDWRITGRPYLTNVYDEHGQGERETSTSEESIRILVATQTFDVREEFVSEIIRSARAADKEFEIVIKTHPNEEKSVYSEYAEENENVSVVDSDLFMHLNESDLTLTINSNVGVESIIVGTPTVCVNRWRPLLPDASYVRYGSVPVSRGGEDLVEFFEGLDEGRLSEIYESEKEFVHEGFELETDATQNMLDEMFGDETGLTSR